MSSRPGVDRGAPGSVIASVIACTARRGDDPWSVDSPDITRLLRDGLQDGSLFEAVYGELRALAQRRMGEERAGHTLQATALVNEVYMRMLKDQHLEWRDRRHFFGAVSEAMRRVLVDHARKVRSKKRGGDRARLELTLSGFAQDDDPELVLALDEALELLAKDDERAAEVARMRIFGGLSSEDVARALDLTPRTVARDWAYARASIGKSIETPPDD